MSRETSSQARTAIQVRGDGDLGREGGRDCDGKGSDGGFALEVEQKNFLTDWKWGVGERKESRMTLGFLNSNKRMGLTFAEMGHQVTPGLESTPVWPQCSSHESWLRSRRYVLK